MAVQKKERQVMWVLKIGTTNLLASGDVVTGMSFSAETSKMVYVFQENPGVVCGAVGLCQSQQAALAKVQVQQNEQLLSNEIPKVDLSQNESPFILNVPLLLYPQKPKDDTPKQETPKQV